MVLMKYRILKCKSNIKYFILYNDFFIFGNILGTSLSIFIFAIGLLYNFGDTFICISSTIFLDCFEEKKMFWVF